jgi:hypothetical protein
VAQKARKEKLAKTMREIVARDAVSNVHFRFPGDESCLLHVYHLRTRWTLCPENSGEVQRPSHAAQKILVTVSFNGNNVNMIKILPQNQKMKAEYFCGNHSDSLVSVCYPNRRRSRKRKCGVHFDNSPIDNSKVIADKLMEEGLK